MYKTFQLNKLYNILNFSSEKQIKLFPDEAEGLVHQVIYVDVDKIKWGGRPSLENCNSKKRKFIINGGWDISSRLLIDDYLNADVNCKSIKQLFIYGYSYWECDEYKMMKKNIEQNLISLEKTKGCENLAQLANYYNELIKTYNNIKKYGYKSQEELGNKKENEITVFIDRNGELQKKHGEGHHRLAIVKLLNIKKIPVYIKAIHYNWALYCLYHYEKDIVSAINEGIKNEIESKYS
ncbi:hypothetical protein [Natranaerofaba carboxydovora]|uniref:hypothetical protein n=1 Tax=Natranaerofaba carboxydovora TaxID=2742683 RepID=UPI001F131FFC|nr:hypothetical protein [Natranaerofaba carboxydovora]UMZ74721.1 hypothetical protein ACONDI_02321 [Natranaerofaba carboxydovora]